MHEFWFKQAADEPLFPDLLWSRPENKNLAGKLLITGGNLHGFAAPAEAFDAAQKAGIGTARVLLPDSLQKTVGRILEAGEYAPSTPSGSFAQTSLAEFLALSEWADGVLLAGDFGRNSETAILLEKFIEKYDGQVTLGKDTTDYFVKAPQNLLERQRTTLVISFAQLQALAIGARYPQAFTFDMDFLRLVERLHDFTEKYEIAIVVKHLQNIFVAVGGQVSSTKLAEDLEVWRVRTAAAAAVWWLQNPTKTFQALTTSLTSINASP
jgi:ADP-dependent NAD(P)H-hydrate dehydratase / NAD(P)H-hydrate epimerase